MSGYLFAIVLSVVLVGLIFVLLRTRKVREKYVGIWLVLALAIVVVAVFPGLAFWLADLVGVETPVNLLFAVGFAVLLAVCIQLSSEVSALEEETRTIAEELALLRLDVERASSQPPASSEPSRTAEPPASVEP
ncbi:DUF2304 domain-containing protein [Cellulomonas sp. ICMP 17802]|uniref:DUF2304 domain-containing protein n=1 Tax=Cellulomonas sp. ICMP 17802 TaxID=3239199 RepID=UPI00351BB906